MLHYSDPGTRKKETCVVSAGWSVIFFFVGGATACSAAGAALLACSTRVREHFNTWREGLATGPDYDPVSAQTESNTDASTIFAELEELPGGDVDADYDNDDADVD